MQLSRSSSTTLLLLLLLLLYQLTSNSGTRMSALCPFEPARCDAMCKRVEVDISSSSIVAAALLILQ
jgi:hypothetical protein